MNSEINSLILDYLTMEGYPNAASRFSKEANIQPQQNLMAVRARQEIQTSIHGGNIDAAIETLNELDPEVCALLLYHIQYIRTLYMIRTRVLHAPLIVPSGL